MAISFKYMRILFLVGLTLFFQQCVPKKKTINTVENQDTENTSSGKKATDEINEAKRILTFLAEDSLQGRETGSKGLQQAAQFITRELESYGIPPYKTSYLDTFVAQGETTFNVLGYLKGTDLELADQMVIIGAHYDHIGSAKEVNGDRIANGANDNASGTAAVLLLAQKLAKEKKNKRSVLFALFSAEEKGLLGSKHLAKELKKSEKDIYVMLNFEMIGVPLKTKEYTAYMTGFETSNFAEKLNEYSKDPNLIGFLAKAKAYNLFKRSDNYPVYKSLKIPSQTISTFDFTNYDYYHHVDDETSKMDFTFMESLIEKLYPAVFALTQTESKEIHLIEE